MTMPLLSIRAFCLGVGLTLLPVWVGCSSKSHSVTAPSDLSYAQSTLVLIVGTAMTPDGPTSTGGVVTGYTLTPSQPGGPSLPAGLSLDGGTGILSGTPTAVMTTAASYTVTASNPGGSATAQVSITVNPPAPTQLVYAQPTVTLIVGQAMAADSPSNSGGAVSSYMVTPTLPAGLSLDGTTGVLAGTPLAAAGQATYTVTATNPTGSTSFSLSITVAPAPVPPANLAYSASTPTYVVGSAITPDTPSSSGGAVTSYGVTPALPAGLSLDPTTGILSGTPSVATAAAAYSVTATNAAGSTTFLLNLTVITPLPWRTLDLLAGNTGGSGNVNGVGTQACFSYPSYLAVDHDGYLYVADSTNNVIRKISPGGVVTTLAGNPLAYGSADGLGGAASFSAPGGVAVDANGYVYVADKGNNTIRKITPAGTVTTLAGTAGVTGHADGTGTSASFNFPQGLAVDAAGNLYVADGGNFTIRLITPGGVVTTVAGQAGAPGTTDGTGNSATFGGLAGLGVDAQGKVYVADSENNAIRMITPTPMPGGGTSYPVTTFAGITHHVGSGDGNGLAATFNQPNGVAVDSQGNVYVADSANCTIRMITPTALVSTLAGTPLAQGSADGTGSAARFYQPQGLAVAPNGNVYVADAYNNTIRLLAPGNRVSTFAGAASVSGSADGTGGGATFNNPNGVVMDPAGNTYVTDTSNNTLRMVTPAGVVTTLAGTAGQVGSSDGTGSAAAFNAPLGLAMDPAGNLYLADSGNNTIRKITPTPLPGGGVSYPVTTLAGTAGTTGSSDGTGPAARFHTPVGVAVDAVGNIYVSDGNNNAIRMITPAGVVTTVAGATLPGSNDGAGAAASFRGPSGLAFDPVGHLFVVDSGNSTLRKITITTAPTYTVSTLAGVAQTTGSMDGPGLQALFNEPTGLDVDADGNLYVADSGNNTIRMITPAGLVSTVVGTAGMAGTTLGPLPGSLAGCNWVKVDPVTGGLVFSSGNGILLVK